MNSKYYIFFLVYLLSYLQISPALESFEKTDNENELTVHESQPTALRSKRLFVEAIIALVTGFIGSLAANIIGEQVNRAINKETGSQPAPENKVTIINTVINNNYGVASQLKEEVQRRNWNAGNALRVTPGGFHCDSNFCREVGDGPNTIGICSPNICHCANGKPVLQQCGTGTVFDPLYKVCNWPYNVKICGF